MLHKNDIDNYPGSLQSLATEIGDLRYDALAEFLQHLSAKLKLDSAADHARNRPKLATTLHNAAEAAATAKTAIDEAWRISAPHM